MKPARIALTVLTVALVFSAAAARAESLGPVQTLQSFQKALTFDPPQVQVFWNNLPPSYQTEIKKLITTFAEKTDPELWDASFRLFGKTAKVARQQSEYIRGSQFFSGLTGGEEGSEEDAPFFAKPKYYNTIVSILETIATSDLRTHEGLRKLDPGKFLANTGTKVAKGCIDLALAASKADADGEFEKLRNGTFTLVEENGNSATVKFTVEGEEPTDIRLTKVEGKWLLADVAGEFEKSIAQAQQSLSQLPDPNQLTDAQKTQVLALAKAIEDGLDQLLAADSQQAFDVVGAQLAQQLPVMFLQAMQNLSGEPGTLNFAEPSATLPNQNADDKSEE